ncbi:MAG: thioredoxin domain-containing protein [Kofleriaceae bacterium]
MDSFEGPSVARPLHEGSDGVAIEWPEEIKRPSQLRWVGLAAFAIVGATAILIGSGFGNSPANVSGAVELGSASTGSGSAVVVAPPLPRTPTYAVPVDGVPAMGRSDAKVTVVVVTDYACSDCERSRDQVEGLRIRRPDDVRIAYKPLASPSSEPSHLAACAAARQGAFSTFDAALWRIGQERVRKLGGTLTLPDAAALRKLAGELGLDVQQLAGDLERCEHAIRTSRAQLAALHVSAPAYFVNGKLLEGPHAGAALPGLVDEELARATMRIGEGTTAATYYQDWVIALGSTTR